MNFDAIVCEINYNVAMRSSYNSRRIFVGLRHVRYYVRSMLFIVPWVSRCSFAEIGSLHMLKVYVFGKAC